MTHPKYIPTDYPPEFVEPFVKHDSATRFEGFDTEKGSFVRMSHDDEPDKRVWFIVGLGGMVQCYEEDAQKLDGYREAVLKEQA